MFNVITTFHNKYFGLGSTSMTHLYPSERYLSERQTQPLTTTRFLNIGDTLMTRTEVTEQTRFLSADHGACPRLCQGIHEMIHGLSLLASAAANVNTNTDRQGKGTTILTTVELKSESW